MSNPLKLIFDNRNELREQLAAIRKKRREGDPRFQKPCIYVAMVTRRPASRKEPNPPHVPVVQVINVQGGRNKPATVTNMLRRGQYPIAYDFPSDETFKQWKQAASQSNAMLSGDIAKYVSSGEDPWAAIRFILDEQIKATIHTWDSADYELKSELEKRMLEEENVALKEHIQKLEGTEEKPKGKKKKAPQVEDFPAESEEELKKELEGTN